MNFIWTFLVLILLPLARCQSVDIGKDEWHVVKRVLAQFKADRNGVPPKATKESLLMQLRNEVVKAQADIMMMDSDSEKDIMAFAEMPFKNKRINFGGAAGQQGLTSDPKLSDFNCLGANPIRCSSLQRYRLINGACNNLENPYWGASSTRIKRFLAPQYADGFNTPRGGYGTGQCEMQEGSVTESCLCRPDPTAILPNARLVSQEFHFERNISDEFSHLFPLFGQFLDHDISLAPEVEFEGCCEHDGEDCFPIIPCEYSGRTKRQTGPYTSAAQSDCLQLTRSVVFCHEESCPRDQMNAVTAFVDASNVYGSETETGDRLRRLRRGLMRTDEHNLLPKFLNEETHEIEAMAGDIRAREHPGLASIHTVFLREHNRIARMLGRLGLEEDQVIYEEARRILSAEVQNIVYDEFLPILLGEETMRSERLSLEPEFDHYDPEVNPSVRNGFATAAFRFGHSMIRGMVQLYSATNLTRIGGYQLRDNFFNTTLYELNGDEGMQNIIASFMIQDSLTLDQFIDQDLTNFLFANIENIGSDLMARNIQRGRDHGLPSYNEYREFCGLDRACSWAFPPEEINAEAWEKLSQLYRTPQDIDLMVGGLAENPHQDGLIGRTFNCIIARQFSSIKFGDRFFFTFPENPYPFTSEQLDQLRRRKLSDIICDNTDLPRVRRNVMRLGDLDIVCGDNDKLNMRMFAQPSQESTNPTFGSKKKSKTTKS